MQGIPCVMIVTGGKADSLEIMLKFLLQNEGTSSITKPMVIIMNGSGGFADLFSSILTHYET